MLHMIVRSDPIFTNNQEILTQILTLLNQKETLYDLGRRTNLKELLKSKELATWGHKY